MLARDLATGARLSQASQGGQALREPGEPQRPKTSRATAEPQPQGPLSGPAAAAAPEPTQPRPAAAAPRPAPFLPQDPLPCDVGGAILPGGAHLRLASDTLGDLSLHLRVRDGVAHVRVEGEQAATVVGRGQELQRALAAEGLRLGQLEVERPQPQAAPPEAARAAAGHEAPQGRQDRPDRDPPGGPAGDRPLSTPGAPQGRRPAGRTTAHHVEA
ncbi:MAG: hypothetical protein IPO09_15685 [Anaeromyxobacter sp.]|nr:hypothetical protein [Anaeromyxobacter sp.]